MSIKYIVKSETHPNQYLVENIMVANQIRPYGFKVCNQIIYEVAEFNSKEDAISACESISQYCNPKFYMPIILELITN